MIEKKIKAETVSFCELHKRISEKYIVPTLQRPYVWEAKKHVKKFLEDIFENKDNYFIGSLVFVSSSNGTIGREEVIDGQQRITTIFLILFAIRDLIKKFSYEKKLESILREINSFIRYNDSFDDKEIIRLKFSDKKTDDFFNKIIKNKPTEDLIPEAQKKIRINYAYIFEELESGLINKKSANASKVAIQEYFNKIKTLQLIGIRCEDHGIAYELFESINATAMSLANIDLIKNFVLKQFKGSVLISEIEIKWKKLEDLFSDNRASFKSFIRHQWISNGAYVNHSGLYSVVEKKYKGDIQEISKYVDELLADAVIYRALKYYNIDDLGKINNGVRNDSKQIKEVLEFLSFLSVDQIYAPLLFFYKTCSKEEFKKYLNRLTAFQFLYKYIPGSPSSAEKIFANMSNPEKNSNQGKNFGELDKLVKNGKSNFKEKYLEKTKYRQGNSGDIQFAIERYIFSKNGPDAFKEPTIEHIITQKEEKNSVVHELGNLTVFEKSINSKMPDNFKEKVRFYKESLYSEHREIIEKYNFDKDPKKSIHLRGEKIAEDLYDIFLSILITGKVK